MHFGSFGKNKRNFVPSSPVPEPSTPNVLSQDVRSSKKLSFLNFFTLSLALVGVQFTWTVELGQGNPYLMELGVPQEYSYLVWLLGPISGFLTHPIVGALSDRCSSKYGRRRPFIMGGVLICVICFGLLAFCREIGGSASSGHATPFSIAIAVLNFGILDFAVNTIQASSRTFIMDLAPFSQQETANLWASVMINVGYIIGYAVGFIDLKNMFRMDGVAAQFQILSAIAAFVLVSTTSVTCFLHKEQVYTPMSTPLGFFTSISRPFIEVFRATLRLPSTIFFLCIVQFFCWFGWFPFLFYSTTYVIQVYTKLFKVKDKVLSHEATRIGTFGSFCNAIVAFAACLFLFGTQGTRYSISLPRLWQFGCLLFTALTWWTLAITEKDQSIAYIALMGICWAIGTWVPMVLLGQILTRSEETPLSEKKTKNVESSMTTLPSMSPCLDSEQSACNSAPAVPISAGIVLGIHNVFVVLPQIVSSLLGLILAHGINDNEPFRPGTAKDPIGWLMRIGGISSFVAFGLIFWYIRILRRNGLY